MNTYSARFDIYRNGAKLTELLVPASSSPQITCDISNSIKTGIRFEAKDDPTVDYLTDQIRPVQIIDGVEHPAGVFEAASVMNNITGTGKTVTVEAYDLCYRLQSTCTETILHITAGTGYIAAIASLLAGAGIVLYTADDSSAVIGTDREDWPVGTSYLEIINTLLSEINYADIWFDCNGYGVLRKQQEPTADNIARVYDGKIKRAYTSQLDIWGKPNVFIAVCQNPDYDDPMVATAENDNPGSSLSITRRGRRIAATYKVDNIADQAALQNYVDTLRNESMMSSELITISTGHVPEVGVGETVGVIHPDFDGVFRETAWTLTLNAGAEMTHTLEKKVMI